MRKFILSFSAFCLQFCIAIGPFRTDLKAQSHFSLGQEAESGATNASQSRQQRRATTQELTEVNGFVAQSEMPQTSITGFGKQADALLQPQAPTRAIPLVLVMLGAILALVWGAMLALAIVTTGALAVVFLVLTIVLAPALVVGIIFIVGGLIAAFGGKKHTPQPVQPPSK